MSFDPRHSIRLPKVLSHPTACTGTRMINGLHQRGLGHSFICNQHTCLGDSMSPMQVCCHRCLMKGLSKSHFHAEALCCCHPQYLHIFVSLEVSLIGFLWHLCCSLFGLPYRLLRSYSRPRRCRSGLLVRSEFCRDAHRQRRLRTASRYGLG